MNMNKALPYDGFFDLSVIRNEADLVVSKIATEGLSKETYSAAESLQPGVFSDINEQAVTKLPSSYKQQAALEALETMIGFLPMIRVVEDNGIITVTGIPTRVLVSQIYKHWKTNRIMGNMLIKQGMRHFSFYSFYAVEIVYMLEQIMDKTHIRNSIIVDIINGIRNNTWMVNLKKPVQKTFDYSKLDELNVTLLPSQLDYLKQYEEKTQQFSLQGYVLAAPPGTGKALAHGTLVKTPHGWKAIEEIHVGDTVTTPDAGSATVTGVYPQGDVDLFEVSFADERDITVCRDHLWKFFDSYEREWIVGSTLDIINRTYVGHGCYIPLAKCSEPELLAEFNDFLIQQKAVAVKSHNSIQVTASNLKLATWVTDIARAVGGVAHLIQTDDHYVINIKHPEPAILGFGDELTASDMRLAIKYIRPVKSGKATCIRVDSEERLFVAENYIVTHNTINGYAMSLVSGADLTIFVVPNNSVEDVWETTLLTRFKREKRYWTSHQSRPIQGNEDYIICHYEALKHVIYALRSIGNRSVYVWLDESHNFNELTSARTLQFIDLCKRVNLVGCTWASGTPFKAIGKEAVPMLRCIDAKFTPSVEKSFIRIFGASKGAALDILGHRMGMVMFKVPKTSVVSNERIEFDQKVTFDGMLEFTLEKISKDMVAFVVQRTEFYKEHMSEYVTSFNLLIAAVRPRITSASSQNQFSIYLEDAKKMHDNFQPIADKDRVVACNKFEREVIYLKLSNEERKEFKRVASVYKYVELTIRGEALGRILTRARINCFKAMVPNANLKAIIESGRKKTLIFTSYVEVADLIRKQVIEDGFNPLIVYGDTNKNLPAIMAEFKRNPNANPLIATFDSLSTAVPVIEASTVVMFNAPFRDYVRDQAISRADRLGQDGTVTVANVLLDTGGVDNISTRSKDIMQWSKDQVDAIMQLNFAPDNKDVNV